MKFVRTLGVLVLALACHHRGLQLGGAGSDGGANPDTAAIADAALSRDVGPDQAPPPDLAPDGPDPLLPYHQFLQQQSDLFWGRWSDCFGAPRALLQIGDRARDLGRPQLEESVRLGLVAVDQATARRCLDTLTNASCDRIADILAHGLFDPSNHVLPECEGALAGQVPPGKTCQSDWDCQAADQYTCTGNGICGRVCTPRSLRAAGAACSSLVDRCAPGTFCRSNPDLPGSEICLPLLQEGAACTQTSECGAGLNCAEHTATSIGEGTCRPIKVGAPCAGNWECPYAYVCAGAAPGKPGTCQHGKPVGAACTRYLTDVNHNVYSDCPPSTECLDLDGKGWRCVDGSPLGGPCGEQHPGQDSAWLDCLEGYCHLSDRADPRVGTCKALEPAGVACPFGLECAPPNRCVRMGNEQRCALGEIPPPAGSRCRFGGSGECGRDAYCALPPDFDELSPNVPADGICAPIKRAGQACRRFADPCEPLTECVQGVCQKCP